MNKQRVLEFEKHYLDNQDFSSIKILFDILLSEIVIPRTEDRYIQGGYLNIAFRARGKNRCIRLPVGEWKSNPSNFSEETKRHDKEEDKRIAKLWREEYMKVRKEFIGE